MKASQRAKTKRFASVMLIIFAAPLLKAAHAESCATADSLPNGVVLIGSGSATSNREDSATGSGGQTIYVKVSNANVLGAPVTVTIARNVSPAHVVCEHTLTVLPQGTVTITAGFFAQPPVSWKVTVSVGGDAGIVTYELYSQAP